MIAVFALIFTVPSMDALVWLILLVASPDVLRQKWIYIASLRVGLICGVAVAICIYSPGWSLVLGSEADEWRGFYGYILAFNAIGGTAVTLGAWAVSTLLGRPARVPGGPPNLVNRITGWIEDPPWIPRRNADGGAVHPVEEQRHAAHTTAAPYSVG
ncbi:hypothetical protein QCD70_06215 [Agreia sp. PsM10]|uniref:hypothetical protein n=1 Tax=Agreia sp. PsM10 TaxID=3030533 RepID=UPI00263A71D4|nr:hypothetical protein [Agreia sp. PsM10]MDN4639829.1 hypothetical protein [Agreia sp. PsM10]